LRYAITLGFDAPAHNLVQENGTVRQHPRSGCPINAALEALGDPWTLLVLRDIIFGNRRHFRELLTQSEEGIASNILSARLKELVAAELLTRGPAARGQRATYSLTEAGIQTVPIMAALGSWGLAHRQGTPELRIRAELLRDGGPQLWEQLMDELRELHLGVPRRDPDQPRASEQLRHAYHDLAGREQSCAETAPTREA
jgi:DNA-binding HxlR family transcriptional regulator